MNLIKYSDYEKVEKKFMNRFKQVPKYSLLSFKDMQNIIHAFNSLQ